jgi:ABC-type multidrug transport system ATPase subunit
MQDSVNAVSVNNLSFNYGRLKVIDGLSLDISPGQAFGLLGANGAGKTTLIRLMTGLLNPGEGSVRVLGEPMTRRRSSLIGYMPQLPAHSQLFSGNHGADAAEYILPVQHHPLEDTAVAQRF